MTNYLFSTGHCPMCDNLHRELERKGLLDFVTDVDCESDEGLELVSKYGVRHTPTLVRVTDHSVITYLRQPDIVKMLSELKNI